MPQSICDDGQLESCPGKGRGGIGEEAHGSLVGGVLECVCRGCRVGSGGFELLGFGSVSLEADARGDLAECD